ncbi:MAG: UPF0149 family protein [Oceanospirillaceae bacterium]|nr:UPF0149 family protein [Oceanospirillaceae bacterium]MCP5350463.1 UPF0149 family protein [Oceanospirillaceae bacterium]
MNQSPLSLPFEDFADMLLVHGASESPSALQGWLTGYLATGARLGAEPWLREAAAFLDAQQEWDEDAAKAIRNFFHQTLHVLKDGEIAYQLLLPSDDEDLSVRMECFAQWANGFLLGFASAGKIGAEDLNDEITEILQHYAAFSQAGVEDADEDEEGEMAFYDLVEHARVTALYVFYHFNQGESAPQQLH